MVRSIEKFEIFVKIDAGVKFRYTPSMVVNSKKELSEANTVILHFTF